MQSMSVATGEPPTGEQERLELCALEPIRTPGAVQPHGALLAVDADFRINHASENTRRQLISATRCARRSRPPAAACPSARRSG
jgi:light-regulated signal transduction histidine kinase (bacteriophytochrome)